MQTVATLSKMVFPVIMSGNTKWKLDKFHVKLGLLSHGIVADEDSIIIPDSTISGPNPAYENGEFLVMIKVNCALRVFDREHVGEAVLGVT